MKSVLASLFVLVSVLTIAAHAQAGTINCMQLTTNDGFLPNIVTIYNHDEAGSLRLKFIIGDDERQVVAAKVQENAAVTDYANVRLFEDGKIKGGAIGIKLSLEKSAFTDRGLMTWRYFDGAAATYSCSSF